MARKKPARPAATRSRKKPSRVSAVRKKAKSATRKARTVTRKAVKSVRKAAAKACRRAVTTARKAAKPLKKLATRAKAGARKAGKTPSAKRAVKAVRKAVVGARAVKAGVTAGVKAAVAAAKQPNLDRPRKTVADIHGVPSSWGARSSATAARTGRAEIREKLRNNPNVSPALTAGDVDADWQSAESSGNEAPGGDNPTPDQDVVDEIGRALGVEYQDDEELQGGDEIRERDRHRWELDPHSAEDFDDKDKD